MAKQPNSESDGLRPLPRPIKLDLPTERPKPQRRLHEQDEPDLVPIDTKYDYTHKSEPEKPRKPKDEPRNDAPTGGGYFKSAQKAYGQRRPRQPKPPKVKPKPKRQEPQKPGLGRGDRLYTPPQYKEPLIPKHVKRVLKFWALGIIAVAFIVLVLMSMFRNNAWAVYLDDRFIGYMPINREIETYTVHEDAVNHLSASYAARVQVHEETMVRETRTRRGELMSPPEMMILLANSFTYQIRGAAIYIDGEQIAVLRNTYEADHVVQELKRPFRNDDTTVDAGFEEDLQIKEALVDSLEELDDARDVIQLLERPVRYVHTHIIRGGDTQGHLALEFNTTIESIGNLNNIGLDAILRPGNTILIEITRPRLTVRTIDEDTIIEDVPMEVETRENPDIHVSVPPRTLTEGSYGQREVRRRIISLNGIPAGSPEIVSSRVLREPVTRVVEVGTSETSIDTR